MDIKLAFLTIAIVVLSYRTDVASSYADEYSAVVCQKFPVRQKELYHFVTFPGIVDKWLNWLTIFSEADQKPIGIGKVYKAIIRNFIMYFQITEFIDGHLIVMESNFVFRPRVELQFIEHRNYGECTCPMIDASKLVIKLYFRRNSIMFQYTLGIVFRAIFEHLLNDSLHNLHAILDKSDSCPNFI